MDASVGAFTGLPAGQIDWWSGLVAARDLTYQLGAGGPGAVAARFSKVIFTVSFSLVTLSLGQVVRWVGTALRYRDRVKHYWVHQAWVVTLFALLLQSAVALFIWDISPVHLTLLSGLFSLIYLGLLAICILLLTPDPERDDDARDCRGVYWRQRRVVLGLAAVALGVAALQVVLLPGRSLVDGEGLRRLVPAVLVLAGVRISDARYHSVLACVAAAAVVIYTAFEVPFYATWLRFGG